MEVIVPDNFNTIISLFRINPNYGYYEKRFEGEMVKVTSVGEFNSWSFNLINKELKSFVCVNKTMFDIIFNIFLKNNLSDFSIPYDSNNISRLLSIYNDVRSSKNLDMCRNV